MVLRIALLLVVANLVVACGAEEPSRAEIEREKLRDALRSAAAAQELFADEHDGDYTWNVGKLHAYGLEQPNGIDMRVAGVNNARFIFLRFCVEATSEQAGITMHWVRPMGLRDGPCRYWWHGPWKRTPSG